MTSGRLDDVPNVDIDAEGNFKYILIKVTDGTRDTKPVVRGTTSAGFYHADILDAFEEKIKPLKLKFECLGGGRIEHQPARKYLKVYSYSQGFGRADHRIAVDILKKELPDYTVEYTDDD